MGTLRPLLQAALWRMLPEPLYLKLLELYYVRQVAAFHEPDVDILRELVRPGDHVVDLGANVGWYTLVLSRLVGPTGRVFSMEPVPPTFTLLARCIRRLKLENVELVDAAVSDRDGHTTMHVPRGPAGRYNFYRARVAESGASPGGSRRFQVALRSLDSLFARGTAPITFVKCDVEGHEGAVLEGARAVLKSMRPAWLMEVSGDPDVPNSNGHRIVRSLEALGYDPYWVCDGALRRRHPGDRSVTYFFLRDEHLAPFCGDATRGD